MSPQHDNKKAAEESNRIAAEEAIAQKQRHMTQFAIVPPVPQPLEKEEKNESLDNYYEAVLKAYRDKYKKEPDIDKNGRAVLNFDSPEDATQFFKALAEQNKPFFAIEIDANGNPTGHYKMSLGNGDFTEKTVPSDQIAARLNEFHAKLAEQLSNTRSNSTKNYKNRLEQRKDSPMQTPPAKEDNRSHTAPNPLSTEPKPNR